LFGRLADRAGFLSEGKPVKKPKLFTEEHMPSGMQTAFQRAVADPSDVAMESAFLCSIPDTSSADAFLIMKGDSP
jgi:hypothetical protein